MSLGATLGDVEMVKKLLDTVPDALYTAVAGIEQFCDLETVNFDEVLGRLKAFKERTARRKAATGGERHGDQLLLTGPAAAHGGAMVGEASCTEGT